MRVSLITLVTWSNVPHFGVDKWLRGPNFPPLAHDPVYFMKMKLDLGGGGLIRNSLRNKEGVKQKRYVPLHKGEGARNDRNWRNLVALRNFNRLLSDTNITYF